eukprot:XP_001691406.1 predicted protein [Chlamydomonas reinhardtii]
MACPCAPYRDPWAHGLCTAAHLATSCKQPQGVRARQLPAALGSLGSPRTLQGIAPLALNLTRTYGIPTEVAVLGVR